MMFKNCPNAKNRMVVAGVAAVNDIVHTSFVPPDQGTGSGFKHSPMRPRVYT